SSSHPVEETYIYIWNTCFTESVFTFLAPPASVRFDSVDYKNVLRWIPQPNSTSLQFYVQWKIYGEPQWLDVASCQGIQKHHCDLSALTSDPREWYYGRVHASSRNASKSAWALSPRFSSRWDTKISPPALKLNATKQGIMVRVKPPRSLVQKMNSRLYFKIFLIHASGEEEVYEMDCCSKHLLLKELKQKTTYCVQAQTLIHLQGKSSARSPPKCTSTLTQV
uniref:Interleukin 22 receptor, alpha 2 n=1 Tax=Myripristis murdjan TaxID=586833 RepID=A0A667Z8D9_9TELE